jgi:glucose uptake protein GlcU
LTKKIISRGLLSGIIWNIANFSSFFVVLYLGVSVGLPLTQTALLVSVAWGLFFFQEIKGRSKLARITVGSILLLLGTLFLVFAK